MIDTARLVPPGFGPQANPLLFGVAEGLSRLFPLPEAGSVATKPATASTGAPEGASRTVMPAAKA